ncbi:MAG: hypothetical protein Q7R59_00700 [bacterium]|nr:hypothetical protein [bacterium]
MGIRPITGQELHKEIDMGKTINRHLYIHNLAGTIMTGTYVYPQHAKELFQLYAGTISKRLNLVTDQTLGKIAACGISIKDDAALENTSLYDVLHGSLSNWEKSGRELLMELAVATVIAAMMDIIRARTAKG